jgi:hypothetical protein
MSNPNKNFQQQAQQTANRWSQQSRAQMTAFMKRQVAYQHAGEQARRDRAARQDPAAYNCPFCGTAPRPGNAYCVGCGRAFNVPHLAAGSVHHPVSWKRVLGIMLLIALAILVLGAVIQARSPVPTSDGTPGIIIRGANIRTGPGTEHHIATTAAAGTRIVIVCRVRTPAGRWDELASPYRGLFVRATLVHSHRPPRC